MQGDGEHHLDLNEEIERQQRIKLSALHTLTQANAELARLEELQRVAHMTPEQRREDVRRRTSAIALVRRIGAAVGVLFALDWLRGHGRQAASATVLTAAAVVGTAPLLPDLGGSGIFPDDGPPAAISEDSPKSMPSGGLDLGDTETPAPTNGPSPPASGGAAGASPAPTPDTAGSGSAPSPAGTAAPLPPDPPGTPAPTPVPPTPEPTASPEPTPEPTATVTAIPTPIPSPTVTITASPPPPPVQPAIPDECLLFADIPTLLELCLLDLEQGGQGQLLDGALGGRTFYG